MSLSDYLLEEIERVAARPPVADVLRRAAGRAGGAPPGTGASIIRAWRDRD